MRLCSSLLCLFLALVSCGGVAARPGSLLASDLPMPDLDEEQTRRAADQLAQAIAAVVERDYPAAREAALASLNLNPRSARARAVLALTQLQQAMAQDPSDHVRAQEAEANMLLADQLEPADPLVGWAHAVFLAEAGHMSAAAERAEVALTRAPNTTDRERAALLGIAGTYRYELGEDRVALPHLRAFVELRPNDAAAWFRLGGALLHVAAVPDDIPQKSLQTARGHAEAAARAFARSSDLAPNDHEAAVSIAAAFWRAAQLAAEQGDDEGIELAKVHRATAANHLRTVAERFPTNAEAWFLLGVMAEHGKDAPESTRCYEQALARDPHHVGAQLNLAAMRATNEPEIAKAMWRRLLASDAQHPKLTATERRRLRKLVAGT